MLSSITAASITATSFIICIVAAIVLGMGTALVFTYKTRHTSSLSLAIAILPAAIALVIMLVNGNVGAGVAVAGAFALVRFRSVPGSARDISAIFVAMAMGLSCGLGFIALAAIFFVIMSALVVLLTVTNFGGSSERERLLKVTVPENLDFEGMFDDIFARSLESYDVERVRTTNMGSLYEITYRVVPAEGMSAKALIDAIRCRNGNLNVSLGRVGDKDAL